MRGHDQTSGRARRRAWIWLIVTALLVSAPGQAQDGLGPQWPGLATDAVDLAAHAIRVWNSGDEQWVVLRGRAAILQGVEGLRAGEAVVRIVPAPDRSTPGPRLEVYAEDQVQMVGQTGPPLRRLRMTLRTEKDVRLKPYEDGGLVRLTGPPKGLPLLERVPPDLEPDARGFEPRGIPRDRPRRAARLDLPRTRGQPSLLEQAPSSRAAWPTGLVGTARD